MFYKTLIQFVLLTIFSASRLFAQATEENRLITVTVHSSALEGNLLNDSPDRNVNIYLPPGYYDEENSEKQYPVIYLLHGYDADYDLWRSGKYWLGKGWSIADVSDYLIEDETIQPMLIVMPSAKNRFNGSWCQF
ncbi:hypothetical protein E3V33_04710 [Candidatus Marinimicrobia bacterium MT.SAG.4]|nr:hypothetical protein E3V33_04710 [Candidatus Marinimicrobia bacterium MT.SAG.4]